MVNFLVTRHHGTLYRVNGPLQLQRQLRHLGWRHRVRPQYLARRVKDLPLVTRNLEVVIVHLRHLMGHLPDLRRQLALRPPRPLNHQTLLFPHLFVNTLMRLRNGIVVTRKCGTGLRLLRNIIGPPGQRRSIESDVLL